MERHAYMVRAGGVLLLLLAVVGGLLWWQAQRIAGASVDRQIATSLAAQELVEQQYRTDIGTRAELIAGNQAFVGYVSQAIGGALPGMEVDTTSIIDLLEERREQLGLDVVAVLNGQGSLVAGTSRFSERREFGVEPLFVQARDGGKVSNGLWLDDGWLLHVAIMPLAADGFNDSFLLVGMPVGHAMASEIADVGAAEVALLAMEPQGQRIAASTLPPVEEKALAEALSGLDDGALNLAGKRYRGVSTPLFDARDGRVLVLSHSGFDLALLLPMLLGGALALAASALVLGWYWSRVEMPSNVLAGLLDRAANGDYHLRTVEQGSPGVRRIADAFNQLMRGLLVRVPR